MSPALSEENKSEATASSNSNLMQGAKRRKPQKTSKVTQQQQHEVQ
jgi:hypothetical protein